MQKTIRAIVSAGMAAACGVLLLAGCAANEPIADPYDAYAASGITGQDTMAGLVRQPDFFAADLCVGGRENTTAPYVPQKAAAGAVFLPESGEIPFAQNIYRKVYPASTTKILTAYLAIRYGNPNDPITVSSTAASVPPGSSVAGFVAGDQITLSDALYGLLICSGNDAANVIAEYISGNTSAFCVLMNQEARMLGATHSHFANPHGYPQEDHYTTVYDLYLIFQAALAQDLFCDILATKDYAASYQNAAGETVTKEWESTNYYFLEAAQPPADFTILGGKTGSSTDSGFCLVLYSKDPQEKPVISIVMKSESKETLYLQMNQLLSNYG